MSDLEGMATELANWLHAEHIQYALIGGLAVSFRTIERFTRDIDLAVAVENDARAKELVRKLQALGYQVQTLLEQTKHGRIATVRLIKGEEVSILVDLLFASSGIELEIAADAEPIEILPRVIIKTATLPALLALKVLAADSDNRPQDIIDIKYLLAEASDRDLERADELLRLIDMRGYHRGKNLAKDFASFKARFLS